MAKGTFVSFAAVKAAVTMEAVLAHYQVDWLRRKGTALVGRCPLHQGQHNSNAFHVDTDRDLWKCFSGDCQATGVSGGNVLDFVARKEGVEVRQAALLLAEWFNIESSPPNQEPRRKATKRAESAPKEPPAPTDHPVEEHAPPGPGEGPAAPPAAGEAPLNPPLTFTLKTLQADHSYLAERGLTAETVAHFGLGFCTRGILKGRVAIPVHNADGELIAYAGRAVEPALAEAEGKYKLPPGFRKDHVLFNLHQAGPLAREHGLVVVEGFFSVFHLHQAGVQNVVALMGSSLSEHQADLLVEAVGPRGQVTLLLDRDEAGRKGAWAAVRTLITRCYVKVAVYDATQPDELSPDQLRALLEGGDPDAESA